ncbi:hypothetical protein FQR65_LT15592 [Abscondita terminalis]|nr:hypothetical protein FQR65_LT15592 [Abscondita terminalis]
MFKFSSTSTYNKTPSGCKKRGPKTDPRDYLLITINERLNLAKAGGHEKDRFRVYGDNVAIKLRAFPTDQRIMAEKLINNVLFEAECNTLNRQWKLQPPSAHAKNHIDIHLLHQLTDSELKELVPSVGQRKRLKTKICDLNGVVVESNLSSASTPTAVSSCSELSRTEILLNDPDSISNNDKEIAPIISDNSYLRPQLPEFDLNTLLQTSPLGKCVLNYYKANQSLDNSNRSRLVNIITKHLYTY